MSAFIGADKIEGDVSMNPTTVDSEQADAKLFEILWIPKGNEVGTKFNIPNNADKKFLPEI